MALKMRIMRSPVSSLLLARRMPYYTSFRCTCGGTQSHPPRLAGGKGIERSVDPKLFSSLPARGGARGGEKTPSCPGLSTPVRNSSTHSYQPLEMLGSHIPAKSHKKIKDRLKCLVQKVLQAAQSSSTVPSSRKAAYFH